MGRHSASHASLPVVLLTAARRGLHGVARPAARRRSAFGPGAAVAAVALTASTAATAFASGSAPSGATATATSSTTTPTAATHPVAVSPATTLTADPATVDAASDVLVRAEFLANEGAAALTPDQAAQIEDARARLNEAVTAAAEAGTTPSLAGLPALANPAQDAGSDPLEGGTAKDAPSTDDAATLASAVRSPDALRSGAFGSELLASGALATGTRTLGSGLTALDERVPDRASRTSVRASLGDLSAEAMPDAAEAASAAGASGDPTATADDATSDSTDVAADPAGAEATGEVVEPTDDAATAPEQAPTTEEIAALTAELSTLLDAAGSGVAVQVVPGPPSAEEIAVQLDQWASMTAGYGNGEIPSGALCDLSFAPGEQLRCDAAYQIEALNEQYRAAFGVNMSVTDSYRSYGSQVAVKASRGYFAAPPGMSNHGWALALDLGGGLQSYGTAQYEWMRANAPAFGWDNPEWARAGGSKNEPWHWEYGDIS